MIVDSIGSLKYKYNNYTLTIEESDHFQKNIFHNTSIGFDFIFIIK